jgi:hypothetical protein
MKKGRSSQPITLYPIYRVLLFMLCMNFELLLFMLCMNGALLLFVLCVNCELLLFVLCMNFELLLFVLCLCKAKFEQLFTLVLFVCLCR